MLTQQWISNEENIIIENRMLNDETIDNNILSDIDTADVVGGAVSFLSLNLTI